MITQDIQIVRAGYTQLRKKRSGKTKGLRATLVVGQAVNVHRMQNKYRVNKIRSVYNLIVSAEGSVE